MASDEDIEEFSSSDDFEDLPKSSKKICLVNSGMTGAVRTREKNNYLKLHRNSSSQSASKITTSHQGEWSCAKCTLINSNKHIICQACQTKRLKPQANSFDDAHHHHLRQIAPIFTKCSKKIQHRQPNIKDIAKHTRVSVKRKVSDISLTNKGIVAGEVRRVKHSKVRREDVEIRRRLAAPVYTAVGIRRRPTLKDISKRRLENARRTNTTTTSLNNFMTVPLPAISTRSFNLENELKFRLPFYKSISQLKTEGFDLYDTVVAEFETYCMLVDFDELFSSGKEQVLRTSEGCSCGKKSTCSRLCECKKYGKICNPLLCMCNPQKCTNTKENALKVASSNVGRWLTRPQLGKVYIDKDGNEFTGGIAMTMYRRDQGKDKRAPKKQRRRRRKKKR